MVDGMYDSRVRKHIDLLQYPIHPRPRLSTGVPTAPPQPFEPQLLRFGAHWHQTPRISGDPVLGVVPVQFPHQRFELVKHPSMSVDAAPVPNRLERPPQSLGRSFAFDNPVAFPAPAPIMGEAQNRLDQSLRAPPSFCPHPLRRPEDASFRRVTLPLKPTNQTLTTSRGIGPTNGQ